MILKFCKHKFFFKCGYNDREIPKKAGFTWDREFSLWVTEDIYKAYNLIRYADPITKIFIEWSIEHLENKILQSRAVDSSVHIPAPDGLEYRGYQKAGIQFAHERDNALIADDMGLGKTIQAIGVMNLQHFDHTLIVCPASVKINWQRELGKWLERTHISSIIYGSDQAGWVPPKVPMEYSIVFIINYDILHKHKEQIQSRTWDLLILDECQYIKNPDTIRAIMVTGGIQVIKGKGLDDDIRIKHKAIKAKKKIALTGTPIENRPKEFFTILNFLDPPTWPSFFKYAKQYCGAYLTKHGWDYSGASNLEELQTKVRSTLMIRRLKSEVLHELPPKIRQIIEIPVTGKYKKVLEKEKKKMKEYKQEVRELDSSAFQAAFEALAEVRHETALEKVPFVVDYIKDILETGEKVICFAWHKDVIEKIQKEFKGCVVLTGDTPVKKRQEYVDKFQTEKEVNLFIGNIQAAGTGITLTAATWVLFAEFVWAPGKITQAEDRPHRIGQKNTVNVRHLVLENSIDAHMIKLIMSKQDTIDQALDIPANGGDGYEEFFKTLFNF